MRGRLTPPPSPRPTTGGSPLDDEIDAAFASIEVVEELLHPEPQCDGVVTIGGRRFFLVKSLHRRP